MNKDKDRAQEEQDIIDTVADRKGREYAEAHATLILLDASRVELL